MKTAATSLFIVILIWLCVIAEALAQIEWTEPVQLTDSIYFMDVRAAMQGSTIHVVGGVAPIKFYYVRSTDDGITWSRPITPASADTFEGCSGPDIIYSSSKVHLAWKGNLAGMIDRDQVYHISSSDDGETWSAPHRVFNRDFDFPLMKYPRIAAIGDTLFISCRVADFTNSYLLSFRSFDAGVTWRDSVVADPEAWGLDDHHAMFCSRGTVHLIYRMAILDSTAYEIFHRKSTDLGATWSQRTMISEFDDQHGQSPSAYADTLGDIFAAWEDDRYGSRCGMLTAEILNRSSTDNGQTWLPEGRTTYTQTALQPACFVLASTFHITWSDYLWHSCERGKVTYSFSTDWGQTWCEPRLISNGDPIGDRSSVIIGKALQDTIILLCFWDRDGDPGTDLYYVRGQYIQTSISEGDDGEIPEGIILSAYPNPFNSSVSITYNFHSRKGREIGIYNVEGQLIKSFAVDGKEGKIYWDATDASGKKVSSGPYFARTGAPQSSSTLKLFYIK